ncbi:unnamed protein product [Clonostachys rosea]|uniref:Uncharacterized protein n=1 Tax=Bionectria ochroleuca TaxID=29856 RepID=A0ABY6TS47_BIOOC|nr:unnamed protein product [Clonostachys rosea]
MKRASVIPFELEALQSDKRLNESISELTEKFNELQAEYQNASEEQYQQLLDKNDRAAIKSHLTASLDLHEAKEEIEDLKAELDVHNQALDLVGVAEGDWDFGERTLGKEGGLIPAEFIRTSFLGTKRKLEEEMYAIDQLGNKRLRTTTPMRFKGLSNKHLDEVCCFVSTAQNEVLRVAAKGGLTNPLHFNVTSRGILGIIPLGMERIYLFHRFKSEPKLIDDWKLAKGEKFSEAVRDTIVETTLLCTTSSSNLTTADTCPWTLFATIHSLSKSATKLDVTKFNAYIKEISKTQRKYPVDKKDFLEILKRISCSSTDSSTTRLVGMNERDKGFLIAHTFVAKLEKIVKGYHLLYAGSAEIENSNIFIPPTPLSS